MKKGIVFPLLLLLMLGLVHAQATKRALFEKFTSVACGSCANGSLVLEGVLNNHPDAIAVAHHVSVFDSMTTDDALEIFNYYAGGTPMGTVNRYGNARTSSYWEQSTAQQEAMSAVATVSVDSLSFDPVTRLLTVGVKAVFTDTVSGEFRFNVILTENDVTKNDVGYHQRNYNNGTAGHPLEGLGHPIVGFLHQHVNRAMLGGAWGLQGSIQDTVATPGAEYSYLFTTSLDEDWDEYKMHAVGVLHEYGNANVMDREILNAEEVPLTLVLNRDETAPLSSEFIAYPNPTREHTKLAYTITRHSDVKIEVWDMMGNQVQELYSGFQAAGSHSVVWEVKGQQAGIYFVTLTAEEQRLTRKVILR